MAKVTELQLHSPPYNEEAECLLLGGLILVPEHQHKPAIIEVLKPQHFYLLKHQRIYKAMLTMFVEGTPIDLITLYDQLEMNGDIETLGGKPETKVYLSNLIAEVTAVTNLVWYAKIVLRKYQMRQVGEAGGSISEKAFEDQQDPEELIDESIAQLMRISTEGRRRNARTIGEVSGKSMTTIDAIAAGTQKAGGISTGFIEFDKLTQGLHPGDFVIIGARPSIGKSALCLDLARNIAGQGTGAIIFSLEMRAEELCNRMLAADSGVPLRSIRAGDMSPAKREQVRRAQERLDKLSIMIDDSPSLRPYQLLSKARTLCAQRLTSVLFIDYLQLMDIKKEKENRQQEIAMISRTLKRIARELDVTVVAFSQLSRDCEKSRRPPVMSDLRESGSLEQDSDAVIFLHDPNRTKTGKSSKEPNINIEVIVAKQRNGPCGSFPLMFRSMITSFANSASSKRWDSGTPTWVSENE